MWMLLKKNIKRKRVKKKKVETTVRCGSGNRSDVLSDQQPNLSQSDKIQWKDLKTSPAVVYANNVVKVWLQKQRVN